MPRIPFPLRPHMSLVRSTIVLLLAAPIGLACSPAKQPRVGLPDTLKIGVLPDQSAERLRQRYSPLVDYLADSLGVECELVIPESYEHMLDLFDSGKIDLARFGGVTFALASQRSGAVGLVLRDLDLRFTSYFLVRPDHPAVALEDLRGASFSFGSRWSTSGHIMPREFLLERGISPEQFFGEIVYSGAHDQTTEWIRTGKVTAGVANSLVVDGLFRDGIVSRNELRILWTTPPYVDYAWALRPEYDEATSRMIQEAFLALEATDPREAQILKRLGADYYLPLDVASFERLGKAVAAAESLIGESR